MQDMQLFQNEINIAATKVHRIIGVPTLCFPKSMVAPLINFSSCLIIFTQEQQRI